MSFAKCAIYLTNIYVVRKEESLPTWERGLKQKGDGQGGNGDYVAPHVGAWIETSSTARRYGWMLRSLPTWERGLKHPCQIRLFAPISRSPRGSVD